MNRYLELRSQFKPGDAFVEQSKGLIPEIIEELAGGVSHAGMIVPWYNRVFCLEALVWGLVPYPFSREIKETLDKGGHVWWLPFKEDNKRMDVVSWVMDKVYTGYDFAGLLGYNLPTISFSDKRMFCSAVLYWACVENGLVEKQDKPWRPVDVPNSGLYKQAILIG